MQKISTTQKILVTAILLVLASFTISYFIFSEIKKRSEHISSLTNELNQDVEKEGRYLAIKNGIQKTKSDLNTIDSYFVSKEGEVAFIELLEREGAQSRVSVAIHSVRVEAARGEAKNLEALVLEVSAEGSWQNLRNFLNKIENLPFGLSFDTVIFRDTKEGWESNFTLRVLKIKS